MSRRATARPIDRRVGLRNESLLMREICVRRLPRCVNIGVAGADASASARSLFWHARLLRLGAHDARASRFIAARAIDTRRRCERRTRASERASERVGERASGWTSE